MATEAQKSARKRYDKRCRRLVITLYPTDEDIMRKVEGEESYTAYIKRLIREDISRNG